MNELRCVVEGLSGADLIARTRELVGRSHEVEADLLVYLGEIEERELYLERAHSSMFGFCVSELGFSEDVAYSRINVARAARSLPGIIDVIRAGQVHLTGVRLLIPHLTPENHRALLARAAAKSKAEIEELIVTFAPRPVVPDMIRKVPAQPGLPVEAGVIGSAAPAMEPTGPVDAVNQESKAAGTTESTSGRAPGQERAARSVIAPLAQDAFKIQFTGSRALRDKLREAQALLRHRVPNGDFAAIVEMALDALIADVKKDRFAVGRKPRRRKPSGGDEQPSRGDEQPSGEDEQPSGEHDPKLPASRHIPDDIRRAVFARDKGRCTFTDVTGRRCNETNGVEFDHIDGFALARSHSTDRIRLLCRAHNQHAANNLYGREFMKRTRAGKNPTRSGTSSESSEERLL